MGFLFRCDIFISIIAGGDFVNLQRCVLGSTVRDACRIAHIPLQVNRITRNMELMGDDMTMNDIGAACFWTEAGQALFLF